MKPTGLKGLEYERRLGFGGWEERAPRRSAGEEVAWACACSDRRGGEPPTAREVGGRESVCLPRKRRRRRTQINVNKASARIRSMMKPHKTPTIIVFVLVSEVLDLIAACCAARDDVGITVTRAVCVMTVEVVVEIV